MRTSFAQFDGPRLVRRDELIASYRLFLTSFGLPETASEEEILTSYLPPRRGGTYLLVQGRYVYFSIKPGQSRQWRSMPADLGAISFAVLPAWFELDQLQHGKFLFLR